MYKRVLLITAMCIGVWAMLGAEAVARCRVIGGVLKCSSICADEFVRAGTKDYTAGCIAIQIEEMEVEVAEEVAAHV